MVELRSTGGDALVRGFAGDAYNTAVHLRRGLGAGGAVSFVSALGDEGLGAAMRAQVRREGLDDALAFTVAGGTPGLYLIEVDAAGERRFTYWRGDSAARGWVRELRRRGGADLLDGCDLVFLSGISLLILDPEDRRHALRLLEEVRRRGGRVAFDPNLRPRLLSDLAATAALTEAATALAHVVLPSLEDGELLWGERDPDRQLARWRALGPSEIALTLGAGGARATWDGGDVRAAAPDEVRVVDTSGAGDAFNGAYLAARLRGLAPDQAARDGVALASEVVGHPGALAARGPDVQEIRP